MSLLIIAAGQSADWYPDEATMAADRGFGREDRRLWNDPLLTPGSGW